MASVTAKLFGIDYYQWDPEQLEDPSDFVFSFTAQIGPSDGVDRYEDFDGILCSYNYLAKHLSEERDEWAFTIWSRDELPQISPLVGCWLVDAWDPTFLQLGLERLCQVESPGPDWETVASRIGTTLFRDWRGRHDFGRPTGPVRRPLP